MEMCTIKDYNDGIKQKGVGHSAVNVMDAIKGLSQINPMNQISTAVLSKSLDAAEEQGAALVAMMDRSMELSVNPNIGSNFDFSV